MKICYIADAGSIHTRRWVNFFARKGHQVHIITSRLGEGYLEGVKLHLLASLLPQHWKNSAYINSLLWFVQARRMVSRIKPDIIDAHYITINGYLAAFAGFHPLILTALGSDVLIDIKRGLHLRILSRYALKKAEMVTCSSEIVRRELVAFGVNPTKIRKIYHGVDTQRFSPQRRKDFKDRLGLSGKPVVISIRNLKPVYNVEMLIRAIPLVLEHSPQTSFIIVGEGEQRQYLGHLASSLGCEKNVRFIGRIAHDELPQYLASSDIYASTSLSDSGSVSLQEAMACGLAPVVTDIFGLRDWVTDGENGFLVPINDIKALADKIVYLLKNKEVGRKFGRLGRKIIQERDEYEREMERMERLYERVVTGR